MHGHDKHEEHRNAKEKKDVHSSKTELTREKENEKGVTTILTQGEISCTKRSKKERIMGVFKKYKDKNGKSTGPWFIQYPHQRNPKTNKVKYKTTKASFSKKKAEKMFRVKVDEFQDQETFGRRGNSEISFSDLIDWGLNQEVMKVKASDLDDKARAKHLKNYFEDWKAKQITPLDVDNFRIKMKNAVSENTGKKFSGTTINKTISLARRIYYLAIDAGIVSSNPFARRGVFKEEPKGKYMPDTEFWVIHDNLVWSKN